MNYRHYKKSIDFRSIYVMVMTVQKTTKLINVNNMKSIRLLFSTIVAFSTLSAFSYPTLPPLTYTFVSGTKAVVTATPVANATSYAWLVGKCPITKTNVLTIDSIQQMDGSSWSVSGMSGTTMVSTQKINVNVTTNAGVPDLVVTGAIGTGAAAVSDVYFTITGTQPANVTFALRGPGLGSTGLVTPKVRVLNSKNVVIGTGTIFNGTFANDGIEEYNYLRAFDNLTKLIKGDTCITINLVPGVYIIEVSSNTTGKTGTFELNVSRF